jgi:hypothetical protein
MCDSCDVYKSTTHEDILADIPRADGAKRRARVLINSPRLFTPGETKALAESKVHQWARASVTNDVEWVVILTDLKNMTDCV